MTTRDEIDPQLSDAPDTRETPSGPRTASDDAQGHGSPYEARRTPPHGDVSPDGKRIWPAPSQTSRMLVWGGMAIGAAALTAASVLAARRVVEMVQGDDEAPEPRPARPQRPRPQPDHSAAHHTAASLAPRFAEMSDHARQEIRDRTRERELEDALAAAHQRAEAAEKALKRANRRSRPARKDFIREVETNTRRLGGSAESAIGSLSAAFSGFRAVAGQATGIIGEFENAARLVRGLLAQGAEKVKEKAEDIREDVEDRRNHRL